MEGSHLVHVVPFRLDAENDQAIPLHAAQRTVGLRPCTSNLQSNPAVILVFPLHLERLHELRRRTYEYKDTGFSILAVANVFSNLFISARLHLPFSVFNHLFWPVLGLRILIDTRSQGVMANIGALPPPPGDSANFMDPPNRTKSTIALHTTYLTIVTFCVMLRIYTRRFISHSLWDWMIVRLLYHSLM